MTGANIWKRAQKELSRTKVFAVFFAAWRLGGKFSSLPPRRHAAKK
jgi:hypothetical protein